jgi:electron transport complex protein RnfC
MALHLAACIECGCCDVVCPSHIPLVRQFQTAKRQQAEWLAAQNRANHAKARYQARLARKAREEQARQDNARRSKESIQDALARLKTRQG